MARFSFFANCRGTLKKQSNQATASKRLVKEQITHCEFEKAQLLIYNQTFTKRLPVGSSLPQRRRARLMIEIPKTYDPKEAERSHYAHWEQRGYFAPEINKDPDAPSF